MGLYKLCEYKGRNRDRCEHPRWGSFRSVRVSLSEWANREVRSKAEDGAVLDQLRTAIRAGTFDAPGLAVPKAGPMTFRERYGSLRLTASPTGARAGVDARPRSISTTTQCQQGAGILNCYRNGR